jgi:hypothetical protein
VFCPVSPEDRDGLSNVAFEFSWVNPHLTLSFADPDSRFEHKATAPGWGKWRPTDPTSPHWHDDAALMTLIAAEINKANRDRSGQRLQRYLALPSTGPLKTIAAFKAYYSAQGGDPARVESNERTYDGLRKAGMPGGDKTD